MSRWTTEGWTTCLGGDFKWTYWEGRSGLDYQLETQTRYGLDNNESAYLNKVIRLELVGLLNDEDTRSIKMELIPTASTYWASLALFHRRIIVTQNHFPKSKYKATERKCKTMHENINDPHGLVVCNMNGSTIIIPAAPTSNPPKETKTVKFIDSFLGGKQLLLIGGGRITYELPKDILFLSKKYWLQLRVCTVHRHEEPFLITITSLNTDGDEYDEQQASIAIPYTMGMWDVTQPILIKFGGNNIVSAQLKLTRQSNLGLSIKDIKVVSSSQSHDPQR